MYNRRHRRKFLLKVHLVLVTKYRKPILKNRISDDVKQKIFDLSKIYRWNILAMETDKDHLHILLSYDATERVCDIVKIIKQETNYFLWQQYFDSLSFHYWKRQIFWSNLNLRLNDCLKERLKCPKAYSKKNDHELNRGLFLCVNVRSCEFVCAS